MRLAVVLACLLAGALAPPAVAATVNVTVSFGFHPSSVTIAPGDSVRWTNNSPKPTERFHPAQGNIRQVVSEQGLFVSPILSPTESFTYTFTKVGVYTVIGGGDRDPRGTIVVRESRPPTPPTLSLELRDPIVGFGDATVLGGSLSTGVAGARVTILQQPYGTAEPMPIAELLTGEGGRFEVTLSPTIQTSYTATFGSVRSPVAIVAVRPIVTLAPGPQGSVVARVGGGPSIAGRFVALQREAPGGTWRAVARARLGPSLRTVLRPPKLRGAIRYRAYLPAGEGYLESWSQTRTIRRR